MAETTTDLTLPAAPPPALLNRLAKPAQATHDPLDTLRRFVSRTVRDDGPDLSQRQLAVLLAVHTTPGPHTVRGMAAALNVSKPAITRALDRLGELDFVRRKTDQDDRRSVLAVTTQNGSAFVRYLAEAMTDAQAEG